LHHGWISLFDLRLLDFWPPGGTDRVLKW